MVTPPMERPTPTMQVDSNGDEHDHTWDDPDFIPDDIMSPDVNITTNTGNGDGNAAAVQGKETGRSTPVIISKSFNVNH